MVSTNHAGYFRMVRREVVTMIRVHEQDLQEYDNDAYLAYNLDSMTHFDRYLLRILSNRFDHTYLTQDEVQNGRRYVTVSHTRDGIESGRVMFIAYDNIEHHARCSFCARHFDARAGNGAER